MSHKRVATPHHRRANPIHPRRPAHAHDRGQAKWLVLAYMAGDNDLEGFAMGDVKEMEKIGSRPGEVEVVVQVDRAAGYDRSDGDWQGTRRYYVTRGADRRRIHSRLLADLGETNTGDPAVLEEFLDFGISSFPAQACALILWNHGSGFYVPPEMLAKPGAASRREVVSRATPRLHRTLFHTTRERLLQLDPQRRGIAYDDRSGDCLDNRELKRVLGAAHQLLGRKVDLVGMDACLMTMLEVAYQIRDHAQILVGSEEVEPGDGWPYDTVLRDLAARPVMTGSDLAGTIVRRYAESYQRRRVEVTQSAIDLSKLDPLVDAVDRLAGALLARLRSPGVEAAVYASWRRTLRFFDNFYVDLHHFASTLAAATDAGEIKAACGGVRRAIEGDESPIIAASHDGARMAPARGLSIYFPPFRDPSAFYRDLDFAHRARWAEFLEAYLGNHRKGA
jgi:cysteine peptidase C11 family protein